MNYILCIIFALMLSFGQILFKMSANYIRDNYEYIWLYSFISWPMILAVLLYGFATILWVYILTKMPLSLAYPFSLAGSAIVIIASAVLFSEPVSTKQIIGIVIVFFGLCIIASV